MVICQFSLTVTSAEYNTLLLEVDSFIRIGIRLEYQILQKATPCQQQGWRCRALLERQP